MRAHFALGAAALAVACGCQVRLSASLPAGAGDLAIAALVEMAEDGRYTVLAHTQLLLVDSAAASLAARVTEGDRLWLAAFTFESAELAAAIAPGLTAAELAAGAVVEEGDGGAGLPAAGRSDFLSDPFVVEDGATATLVPAFGDPVRSAVCDVVAGWLTLRIEAADSGASDGGFSEAGADSGADSGGDSAAGDAGEGDSGAHDGGASDGGPSLPPCGTMVLVPAGDFVMGSDSAEGEINERPEHIVSLSAYEIDACEVTNAEWRACVAGGGCTPPGSADSYTRVDYYTDLAYDDFPVVNIRGMQADDYCNWAGKRLPTEAEWEKAARGGCEVVAPATCGPEDERTYPWGNAAPTCATANYYAEPECVGDTTAVGSYPAGNSPYGVRDMAGNAAEWVADWYVYDYYSTCASGCVDPLGPDITGYQVRRGGGFGSEADMLRVADRDATPPSEFFFFLGLRCARTP